MASPFLLLPLEIRIKIYGYLFRDIDGRFDLIQEPEHSDNSKQTGRLLRKPSMVTHTVDKSTMILRKYTDLRPPFNTLILRTCHQIHHEAVTILYQKTCFTYEPWTAYPGTIPSTAVEFSPDKLDMIRTLHLCIKRDSPAQNPRAVVGLLNYFSAANCSLKRLVLDFELKPDPSRKLSLLSLPDLPQDSESQSENSESDDSESDNTPDSPCYTKFLDDTTVAEAIPKLNISEEIQVNLTDEFFEAGQKFEPFLRNVAESKSWACQKKVNPMTGNDHYVIVRGVDYYWCWSLRPPAKSPSRHGLMMEIDMSALTIADDHLTST